VIHEIPLERGNLHGHFSRDLPPILTVDSGDSLFFATLDAGWHSVPEQTHFPDLDPELDGVTRSSGRSSSAVHARARRSR
jgi:hypothetical protein